MARLQIYAMSLQRSKGLKIMSVSDIGKRMTNISQAREKFSTQPPDPFKITYTDLSSAVNGYTFTKYEKRLNETKKYC